MALIRTDVRNAICIAWWSTEKEADAHAKRVAKAGDTYHGGFCDGAWCGRERGLDAPGMFAVTFDHTK